MSFIMLFYVACLIVACLATEETAECATETCQEYDPAGSFVKFQENWWDSENTQEELGLTDEEFSIFIDIMVGMHKFNAEKWEREKPRNIAYLKPKPKPEEDEEWEWDPNFVEYLTWDGQISGVETQLVSSKLALRRKQKN